MFRIPLTLLLIISCATTIFSQEPDKKLHHECVYPTCTVKSLHRGETGTGVAVRSEKQSNGEYYNVLVTCAHVVRRRDSSARYAIGVPTYSDWSSFDGFVYFNADVVWADDERDLAVLVFITRDPCRTSKLKFDFKPYLGTALSKVGTGGGDEPRYDVGRLTSRGVFVGDDGKKLAKYSCYRTSIPTIKGDSGSPVFWENEVIGIAHAIRVLGTEGNKQDCFDISFVTPIHNLKTGSADVDNIIDYVFDKEKPLPVLPYLMLKAKIINDEVNLD